MKKINDYRKLLGVTKTSTVKEIKTTYRNFMKDLHPDLIQDEQERHIAEEKSKQVIEAYHFLTSIAPETIEQALPEYTQTITACTILGYSYKGTTLQIDFVDGSSYEYFDVTPNIYKKFLNSDNLARFARRHIYFSFVYRKVSKAMEEAAS